MEALAFAARIVLAAVFLAAGTAKLGSRERFAGAVRDYGLLPRSWVQPVATVLPWLELCCGALLAVGLLVRPVGAVAVLLLATFTAGVGSNLVRGRRVGCGCFGETATRPATWATVARNVALVAAAVLVVVRPPLALSVHGLGSAGLAAADAIAIAVGATALLLSWAVAAELRRLPASGPAPTPAPPTPAPAGAAR